MAASLIGCGFFVYLTKRMKSFKKLEDQILAMMPELPDAESENESDDDSMEDLKESLDDLKKEINYLKDWIKSVGEEIYWHKKGHLPKVPSATQMQRILEILELDSDFEIEKPKIDPAMPHGYATTVAGSRCLEF